MKSNLILIAEGNASKAVNAYNNKIHSSNWMDHVDEEEIYRTIGSPEFSLYMDLLGLEQHEEQSRNVA